MAKETLGSGVVTATASELSTCQDGPHLLIPELASELRGRSR